MREASALPIPVVEPHRGAEANHVMLGSGAVAGLRGMATRLRLRLHWMVFGCHCPTVYPRR